MARVSYSILLLAGSLSVAGCEGSIGAPQSFTPGLGADGGTRPDAPTGDPTFNPFESGSVTIGVLCGPNGPETRMVFTEERGGCERHAQILANRVSDGDRAIVSAPLVEGPTEFQASAEFCVEGDCEPSTIAVQIDAYSPRGAIGEWASAVGDAIAGGQLQATVCAYDAYLPGKDPNLVPDLKITEVALYQGVKVPLAENGNPASTPLPIIQGRPGLLRVFVEPQVGFLQTGVIGALAWDRGDGNGAFELTDAIQVAIPSVEENQGTTFDFELAAEDLVEDATWSISLRGAEACSGVDGETSGARFPSSGTVELDSEPVGTLSVVLVPFRYDAGGGTLPDTSPAEVERYRERLYSMFPVADVEVTVRDQPVPYAEPVTGASGTWSPYLQTLLDIRAQDNPAPNTYYYGIIDPGGDWSGGTAGLGPLASAGDASRRGAVGLAGSTGTCAHELGHASGRAHAPCGGAGNPDPNYPHDGGIIGIWGYDITNGSFKQPTAFNDFMGYCNNDWISDYTFIALQQRYSFVNQFTTDVQGEPTLWRSLLLGDDGRHRWTKARAYPTPPYSESGTPVTFLDADGHPLALATAMMTFLDHADEILLFVPAAPDGTEFVEVDGERLPY